MTIAAWMHHRSQLAPFITAATLLVCAAGSLGADALETAAVHAPLSPATAAEQISKCLYVAGRPSDLRFPQRGVLWLTGDDKNWTRLHLEAVKRWVAEGHVCWMDIALATRLGLTVSWGGGSDTAVVAPSAAGHPLVEGVKTVRCADAFLWARGLPTGAMPIMVDAACAEHVVLGLYELGQGAIILRPPAKPNVVSWHQSGERRWIEPDLADGAQLLHNITLYSLGFIQPPSRAGVPPSVAAEEWVTRPSPAMPDLLTAFRVYRLDP